METNTAPGGVQLAGDSMALLAEFGRWLGRERGLSPVSVQCYSKQSKAFLAWIGGAGAVSGLDAGKVTAFMVDWTAGRNTWTAKAMVTSLRAFLRFAHATGRTAVPLAGAVPAVASWRMSSLPRGMKAAEIGRLLAGCDRDTAMGLRDYAILSLLARLGLRGAEAAGLKLGDIDWRAGEVTVTGKGSKTERLPLPAAAGEALAAWLKDEQAVLRVTGGVRDDPAAPPARDAAPGPGHHGQGLRAGRAGADGSAPPAALPGDRDAAGRGLAARGRPGAPPPQHAVHLDLCQGRPERAAPAGAALAGERGMSGLRARAEEYLAMRRALGFKLTSHGSRLMSFVRFCEDRGATTVTTDLAVEWATSTPSDHEAYQARRLDIVRIFARHLQPLDPATEVPPEDVLDRRQWRIPPYLYSAQEVTALMAAARTLQPAFRAKTWRTLVGLLAVTGMRQGEACRLTRRDVDLNAETATIADSKFGKSRMVFLHPTAAAALRAYDRARDEAFPGPAAGTFLVNSRGGPLDSRNTSKTFAVLVTAAGIKAPPGQRAPRLHDLRHVFTVATLLDWYRDGGDVQARLPVLSTWLGHIDPKSTYYYLSAVPELLALAAARLEPAGRDDEREAS